MSHPNGTYPKTAIEATRTVARLNQLLDSKLDDVLGNFADRQEIASVRLAKNRETCESKAALLKAKDADGLNDALRDKVLAIEKQLSAMPVWKPLHTKDGLKNTVRYIYSLCPDSLKRGPFLKESVARSILRKHPPVQMLEHVPKSEIRLLSPLSVLALTRFTETKAWQDTYLDMLSGLSSRHFTEREMRCLVVDSRALAGVLTLAGEKQKPWRISHNKEAGIIICFSLDEAHTLPAPLTQYVAVFMHYFFETASAAEFSRYIITTDRAHLGERLKSVIRSHAQKFDFFHPNAYSEHLFWERATELMSASFPHIAELQFFADTVDCGGYLAGAENGEIVSLNLIDHLWNVNLAHQKSTSEYFGEKRASFLYHFREGLWYDIFRNLLGFTKEEMRQKVIRALHLGDRPFTSRMIEGETRA